MGALGAGQRRGESPFGAHEGGERGEQLRDVPGDGGSHGRAAGDVETGERWAVRGDDQGVGVEATMDEAGRVQQSRLPPDPGEQVVGDEAGLDRREPDTLRLAHHEEGGPRSRHAGSDHVRGSHAGIAGGQQRVRLVLYLLEPGQVQCSAALLVEQGPPELGEELGLGLVPSQHLDLEGALGGVGGQQRGPLWLGVLQADLGGPDAQLPKWSGT